MNEGFSQMDYGLWNCNCSPAKEKGLVGAVIWFGKIRIVKTHQIR